MKTLLLFIILLMTSTLMSQSLGPDVISSSGDYYANASAQLSFTIGEPIIATHVSGSNELTQGFHQTKLIISEVNEHLNEFDLNIFPNPSPNSINISVDKPYHGLSLVLFSIDGRIIYQVPLTSNTITIDLSNYSKGMYLLNVVKKNQLLRSYRIIKN